MMSIVESKVGEDLDGGQFQKLMVVVLSMECAKGRRLESLDLLWIHKNAIVGVLFY